MYRFLITALLLKSALAHGNPTIRLAGSHPLADSLLPVDLRWRLPEHNEAATTALQDIEQDYGRTHDHSRTLARLLPLAEDTAAGICTKKVRFRLFTDLARVCARLRMYSLAMRCYYNALKGDTELPGDSACYHELPVAESAPAQPNSIIASFADGRETSFYALLLEVKQPVPGRRRAFTHINNVGHTFITLIKYNRDGTIVSRSFGFYPHKKGILSATPLHPSAPSWIKDDSRHDWDESAGKLISYRQFTEILRLLRSYHRRSYHLSHNNCTDFGLALAQAAGICVQDTAGRWPLGYGNNPGSLGQSLLEGKVADTGTGPDELFVVDNLPSHH